MSGRHGVCARFTPAAQRQDCCRHRLLSVPCAPSSSRSWCLPTSARVSVYVCAYVCGVGEVLPVSIYHAKRGGERQRREGSPKRLDHQSRIHVVRGSEAPNYFLVVVSQNSSNCWLFTSLIENSMHASFWSVGPIHVHRLVSNVSNAGETRHLKQKFLKTFVKNYLVYSRMRHMYGTASVVCFTAVQ